MLLNLIIINFGHFQRSSIIILLLSPYDSVFVAEAAMAAKKNDKGQGIPESSYFSCIERGSCQQNHQEKNKGLVDNHAFWFRSSSAESYCKEELALKSTTSMAAAQWFVYL